MANVIKGLLPSGKAPSVLRQEIIDIADEKLQNAIDRIPTEDKARQAAKDLIGQLIIRSSTPPEHTKIEGIPVIWLDTRQKDAWVVTPPTISEATGRGSIPTDEGATYQVNGQTKPPGEYQLTKGESWRIQAIPKIGYQLSGTTTWELAYHGLANLNKLAAEIAKDTPEHHLTLAGASPYADSGSHPVQWTSSAPPATEGWGSSGAAFTTAGKENTFTHNASAWSFEAVIEPLGKLRTHEYAGNVFKDDRYSSLSVNYLANPQASTGDYPTPGRAQVVPASSTTVAKEPTHLALVFDGDKLNIYVNGTLAGSGQGYKRTYEIAKNAPITVGSPYVKIGQAAFYRKALSASRIAAHAQAVTSA